MTWTAIAPYTDPALEFLAKEIADRLNARQPDMVRRWIASELSSYRVEEYPILQVQCITAEGEALEMCKGSIRYIRLNEQVHVGEQQQLGFRWTMRAIAKALREIQFESTYCEAPIKIAPQSFKAEVRSGSLKLADGAIAANLTWVEVWFDYADSADLGVTDC